MARAAQLEEAKQGFLQHRDETQGQIERLERVFEIIGKNARGKTCEAIQGIIAEAEEIIESFKDSPALDAGLIASAQAVEHYEIARYGTLVAWAGKLGIDEGVPLLQANLDEEGATDKTDETRRDGCQPEKPESRLTEIALGQSSALSDAEVDP